MTTPHSNRSELLRQFFVFGVIGTAGFVVDTSTLYLAMGFMGLDHYSGRVVSWFVAATFTWAMNRRFTFSDSRPPFRQWLAFLASNAVGGLVNFGIYAAMVTFMPLVAEHPVIGVAVGAIAGLFFNFSASKYVVFKRHHRATP
jgi:putative flippase GtrA